MGRYESQRAIAARTISERRQGRKRSRRKRHGGWLAWFLGRALGLAATAALVTTGAWYAGASHPIAAPAPVIEALAAKFGKSPFGAKWASAEPIEAPAPAEPTVYRASDVRGILQGR